MLMKYKHSILKNYDISDLSSPGDLLFKLGGHKYFALFIALEANMEEFHFIYDLHCQAYDSKDFIQKIHITSCSSMI